MEKLRKEVNGPLRNKERTKLRLLNAVGEIITREGFTGLRINKIVKQAQVDRKTLYEYFGTVENLIETYIRRKDYYMAYQNQAEELVKQYNNDNLNELIKKLLLGQLDRFSNDDELQQILLWHLSEENPLLSDVNEKREKIGSVFMSFCKSKFENTPIDIRSRIALLIGGIYFLVLYSKKISGTFCEIDLNTYEGMESIRTSITQMIDEAFQIISNEVS